MSLTFDAAYFDRNIIKFFQLHRALKDSDVEDDQLEDDSFMRRFIRDGLGIKNKLGTSHCVQLKDYIESQGGVKAFLEKSPILSNVFVAMAVYNLNIQNEFVEETCFINVDMHQTQRLFNELLGEEAGNEKGAEIYNDVCKAANYKRAEIAVTKYVDDVTTEQVELVKTYLRDYFNSKIENSSSRRSSVVSNRKSEVSESSGPSRSTSPSNISPNQPESLQALVDTNHQHKELAMKELELNRREASVIAREAALTLREKELELHQRELAVAARESALAIREKGIELDRRQAVLLERELTLAFRKKMMVNEQVSESPDKRVSM